MEGAATACAKVIATTIPIAMPVSDVFREMDTKLFPGVRGAEKGWDYCYQASPLPPISRPTVSISNKAKRVADLQFDFGIKVEHSLCSGTSCFADDVSTNRERRDRKKGTIR